jgi:hypothetical protein
MTSEMIRARLDQLRAHQAALVVRNVRIIDGAKPRNRVARMRQVMERTKVNRDREEQLERQLRQAVNDESNQ